jgi:hypothetical protein
MLMMIEESMKLRLTSSGDPSDFLNFSKRKGHELRGEWEILKDFSSLFFLIP